MKMFIYVFTICLAVAISGCKKDIPKPETKIIGETASLYTVTHDIPVFKTNSSKEEFFVKHKVEGGNVMIECIIQGITFRDTAGNNKGKIILYVDGKKEEEISSAAFIVKGLLPGTHRLTLEVTTEESSSVIMKKEFDVTIR
ncbi:hypothetical protein [Cytobacillus praedii]|uniref:Lipoprotein n=1 Tax=Cytobacillus praedii TaxID=1742358 RepID=A0A4R1AZJ9_9BACI|nr:hypothetical protein [Cytobacillus praedii]TCJ06105.1 hypothetical protein E0Y62_02400 [Cytobacillus praedii]